MPILAPKTTLIHKKKQKKKLNDKLFFIDQWFFFLLFNLKVECPFEYIYLLRGTFFAEKNNLSAYFFFYHNCLKSPQNVKVTPPPLFWISPKIPTIPHLYYSTLPLHKLWGYWTWHAYYTQMNLVICLASKTRVK